MKSGHARLVLILAVCLALALLVLARLYSTLKTTSLRMAEICLVDAGNNAVVTNFHLKTPPVASELHQIVLLRAPEGKFILARIGDEPLRVTIFADGYTPARVNLGDTAFRNDPIVVRMERKPDIKYRKEVYPIGQRQETY